MLVMMLHHGSNGILFPKMKTISKNKLRVIMQSGLYYKKLFSLKICGLFSRAVSNQEQLIMACDSFDYQKVRVSEPLAPSGGGRGWGDPPTTKGWGLEGR